MTNKYDRTILKVKVFQSACSDNNKSKQGKGWCPIRVNSLMMLQDVNRNLIEEMFSYDTYIFKDTSLQSM